MSNWSPCSRILRPGRLAEPRGGRRTSAVRGRAAARSNAAVIADLLWAHLLPRVEPEPLDPVCGTENSSKLLTACKEPSNPRTKNPAFLPAITSPTATSLRPNRAVLASVRKTSRRFRRI